MHLSTASVGKIAEVDVLLTWLCNIRRPAPHMLKISDFSSMVLHSSLTWDVLTTFRLTDVKYTS